jgi:hypothetical protein
VLAPLEVVQVAGVRGLEGVDREDPVGLQRHGAVGDGRGDVRREREERHVGGREGLDLGGRGVGGSGEVLRDRPEVRRAPAGRRRGPRTPEALSATLAAVQLPQIHTTSLIPSRQSLPRPPALAAPGPHQLPGLLGQVAVMYHVHEDLGPHLLYHLL